MTQASIAHSAGKMTRKVSTGFSSKRLSGVTIVVGVVASIIDDESITHLYTCIIIAQVCTRVSMTSVLPAGNMHNICTAKTVCRPAE